MVWWWSLKLTVLEMESRRGIWLFVGQLGIGFKIIPRFCTKFMVKHGAPWGIRVTQFGPLVLTWKEVA